MKMSTTQTVAGRLVEETLGVVRGSVLWSRRVMKLSHGAWRGLSYGTTDEMADGLRQAKENAEAKVLAQAKTLGADAIINLRIQLTELNDGMFEAVATGTAVTTSLLPQARPVFDFAASDEDVFSAIPVFDRRSVRLVSSALH